MVEPYDRLTDITDIYSKTRPVRGRVVAVLRLRMDDRNLSLIVPRSRVLRHGDVVEMACTDESEAGQGATVNSVGYLGFVEIEEGGVVPVGSRVVVNVDKGDVVFGTVVGFDETHMPNHMNVVIRVPERTTGEEAGWRLEQKVTFAFPEEEKS